MKRLLIQLTIALGMTTVLPCHVMAEEFKEMYQKYTNAYMAKDKAEEFYELSRLLKDYYLKGGNIDSYYKIELNEAVYESDHNNNYQAIRKSVEMFNKMMEEDYNGQSLVFLALGNIFETSGNHSVAKHYYQEAIERINDRDDRTTIDAHLRMASLLKLTDPEEASKWNEKYASLNEKYPQYRQVYLFINAVIAFAKNDKEAYLKARENYLNYHNQHKELDNYGMKTIKVIDQVFDGKYEEALSLLNKVDVELNEVSVHDMRIYIYRMQGRTEDALNAAIQRILCVDSLNSGILQHNVSAMSTDVALNKTRIEAAAERQHLLTIVLLLAAALIILLTCYNYFHQKNRKLMKQRNEQLQQALAMAEESNKMKSEFVRSVSHEIRTPLNAINGFTDIITTPGLELAESERQDLIDRINLNVKAITDIVDNMLRLSERSSNNYPRTDNILCNQYLSQLINSFRDKVNPDIELRYTTNVINRFQLQTNQEGLHQILVNLIENSIKFTTKGSIELNCYRDNPKNVVISVIDTGSGITEKQHGHLFEKFYKADSFQQGLGLGLSISKMIAQKLGGELTCDESYTEGARFVLTLPTE